MSTKLFNRDSNSGLSLPISLGGLPLFGEDLTSLEDNATSLFGNLSLLKGFACVLRGCLVDALNTNAQTVTLTDGIILLNDVAMYFSGGTFNYPFSIIPGTVTVDERIFFDGNPKAVANDYSYAIRTSFTFPSIPTNPTLKDIMPSDLSNTEIYFDPFTAQKATTILNNLRTGLNEIRTIAGTMLVNVTETGQAIVGTAPSALFNGVYGRWKYLGYTSYRNQGIFDIKNFDGESGIAGTFKGENAISLALQNIPAHTHDSGSLIANKDANSKHQHYLRNAGNVSSGDGSGGAGMGATFNDIRFSTPLSNPAYDGSHSHTISGQTGNGETFGLKQTPSPVDVSGKGLLCNIISWNGYQSVNQFYNFNSNLYQEICNM
jgi:hypothetical protein